MFNYLSRIPEYPTKDSKCIILLHGVGSNQEDLFALAENFSEETYVFSLQGCFSLGGNRYAWYPVDFSTGKPLYKIEDVEKGYQYIVEYISHMSEKYQLTSEQIFLMGFSQGAIMSYYTLWRSPELIGGIIALSGRLLTEIDTSHIKTERYIGKKVFIGHGTQDTIMPVSATEQTIEFVHNIGLGPTVNYYPIAHSISRDEMDDIANWIESSSPL